MARNPYVDDVHTREARRKGYPARSVFKLQEMDRRWRLLRRGATVLDLGCAPGSWSMYAAERVGSGGWVLGVDLQACDVPARPALTLVQGDAVELDADRLAQLSADRCPPFDVVLSDMAPRTTGIKSADHAASVELCELALGTAQSWLRPRGAFVVKVFAGPDLQDFDAAMRGSFTTVKRIKPRATRSRSVELYLVGLNYGRGGP